jgi:hypothetical protein
MTVIMKRTMIIVPPASFVRAKKGAEL